MKIWNYIITINNKINNKLNYITLCYWIDIITKIYPVYCSFKYRKKNYDYDYVMDYDKKFTEYPIIFTLIINAIIILSIVILLNLCFDYVILEYLNINIIPINLLDNIIIILILSKLNILTLTLCTFKLLYLKSRINLTDSIENIGILVYIYIYKNQNETESLFLYLKYNNLNSMLVKTIKGSNKLDIFLDYDIQAVNLMIINLIYNYYKLKLFNDMELFKWILMSSCDSDNQGLYTIDLDDIDLANISSRSNSYLNLIIHSNTLPPNKKEITVGDLYNYYTKFTVYRYIENSTYKGDLFDNYAHDKCGLLKFHNHKIKLNDLQSPVDICRNIYNIEKIKEKTNIMKTKIWGD